MRLALLALLAVSASACFDDGEPQAGPCEPPEGETVPNEGWQHVEGDDQLVYDHNPPASGPHFNVWAAYQVHDGVVSRGNWVHNLEHGAIVLLIGPDASEAQRQLMRDTFKAIPNDPDCGHRRALVTEDPLLDSPIAVVAADHVLEDPTLTVERIVAFAEACRDHAPEDICL